MNRLTIEHEVIDPATPIGQVPDFHRAPDGTFYRIAGRGDGLDQIARYAEYLAMKTDRIVVHFEVFWPWETEEQQTWDALEVNVSKIAANDPADWWATTLPPYDQLPDDIREHLGLAPR